MSQLAGSCGHLVVGHLAQRHLGRALGGSGHLTCYQITSQGLSMPGLELRTLHFSSQSPTHQSTTAPTQCISLNIKYSIEDAELGVPLLPGIAGIIGAVPKPAIVEPSGAAVQSRELGNYYQHDLFSIKG